MPPAPKKKNHMKNLPTLSVIIQTKNEAHNLEACIASIKHIAQEVIVVDMKSTDGTVVLAKKFGAAVFSVNDYGFVEPARNTALRKAKGQWILLLDADERVPHTLAAQIQVIMRENTSDVVRIPRKNMMLGKWMKYSLR